MEHAYKGNVKIGFGLYRSTLLILLTFFINLGSKAQEQELPATISDTTKPRVDTVPVKTVETYNVKTVRDITAPVFYNANDSLVMDMVSGKMYLYGSSSTVNYIDNELAAPLIEYSQKENLVTAVLVKDSLGKVVSYPSFRQGDFKSQSDTIRFNPVTQKGITKGTYTQQGEIYVYGEKIKKVDDEIFYAYRGRFTTCNLDTPHFAFVSKKIKFINEKVAFTGPVHPEFEGVPVPIMLPFGIYPMQRGRHSGLIAPSFTANDQMGLALEGLGYYYVFNDYIDAVLRGTIYSYGGWNVSLTPRYYKRYRYTGEMQIDFQNFKTNFKGDPDYSSSRSFNIYWRHQVDGKAKPGTNFSAYVNAGSTKFNEHVPNSPTRNFQNMMQSSISYSRSWKNRPYNVAIRASHNQNNNLRRINLNMPDVNFNLQTIYPFRRKEPIGSYKWYENIGVALNTNARSMTHFYDTSGGIMDQISKNFIWGATHQVPITLSLPSLGPIQISPSVTYQEKWYQSKLRRSWDPVNNKLDTIQDKGFYTAREMTFGLGASTRIFGMFIFNPKSRVKAIRHEIRPFISLNYKPDMNKNNYEDVQYDPNGNVQSYYIYDERVAGIFGRGKFGGLSFGIDNNISMKTRSRKDSTDAGDRKITLIDGFGVNGAYNFMADSFKLSNLTMHFRTNIMNKFNVTASASFDPYRYDAVGNRLDEYVWKDKFLTLGKMQSANISMTTSFRGGEGVTSPQNVPNVLPYDYNGMPLDEYQQEALYMRNNPGEYADFSIPWSVDMGYSMTYTRYRVPGSMLQTKRITQDVNFNASMNLTPKWKIGMNGIYNLTLKELGVMSMYLSREMHCWQMSINIAPVGRYRFFTINISPKSPMLRDLKVNRTRYFYDL